MIRSISSETSDGERLELILHEIHPQNGIKVVDVDGLGGPDGVINTLESPNIDGSNFNFSKSQNRNVVITLVMGDTFEGDSDLGRLSLYKFFQVTSKIKLGVVTDTRETYIEAYVESNGVNIFSKTENTQISLICTKPYFKDVNGGSIVLSGVTDEFTFPFCNDSLTEDLITFGEVTDYISFDTTYLGDKDTGVLLTFEASGPSGDLTIFNTTHGQKVSVNMSIVESIIGSGVDVGDKIVIDTRRGQKSATLIRAGVGFNILGALTRNRDWIRLYPGVNNIVYDIALGRDQSQMILEHDILYEGV